MKSNIGLLMFIFFLDNVLHIVRSVKNVKSEINNFADSNYLSLDTLIPIKLKVGGLIENTLEYLKIPDSIPASLRMIFAEYTKSKL